MNRPVPAEVIFRRLVPSRFSLEEQKVYFGAADSLSTGNSELDGNLLGFRDTVNAIFESNIQQITPPPGMTRIHMEYLRSSQKAAMAFYGDDVAFIAITDQLVNHTHQIAEALIRSAGVLEFLGITLTPERQEALGSALLTLQLQIAETHELGHILHGHCEESALFTPHIDSHGANTNAADKLRAQAMEVDADGYVPHMLLKNLFEGGVGEALNARLAPAKPMDDFLMSLLTLSTCSLFYL